LAAGVDGIGRGDGSDGGNGSDGTVFGMVSRQQALAAGRARLARRRLLAGTALTLAAIVAATGYLLSGTGPGADDGHAAVTASTTPSTRQGPAIGTAARIDPSSTPSASQAAPR
jgi:hypothetical protein